MCTVLWQISNLFRLQADHCSRLKKETKQKENKEILGLNKIPIFFFDSGAKVLSLLIHTVLS